MKIKETLYFLSCLSGTTYHSSFLCHSGFSRMYSFENKLYHFVKYTNVIIIIKLMGKLVVFVKDTSSWCLVKRASLRIYLFVCVSNMSRSKYVAIVMHHSFPKSIDNNVWRYDLISMMFPDDSILICIRDINRSANRICSG